MAKNKRNAYNRMWRLVRAALLWSRKGGELRRRLMMELRVVPKLIKNLKHSSSEDDRLHYGERELSFDKTPIFHVKMYRPTSMRYLIPCISPQVDFDYDFDLEEEEEAVALEEEGIDVRAEEFIDNFYKQIKLQRQISFLEYNESNC